MILSDSLKRLAKHGCYPAIYRRGPRLWRAHVNAAGNYWHDGTTPLIAMQGAIKLWRDAGKPMDGMAADAAESEDHNAR